MNIAGEAQLTSRATLLDEYNHIVFASFFFPNSTYESVSCVSDIEENTYSFDEEIVI